MLKVINHGKHTQKEEKIISTCASSAIVFIQGILKKNLTYNNYKHKEGASPSES
jgi:hypothetical protein